MELLTYAAFRNRIVFHSRCAPAVVGMLGFAIASVLSPHSVRGQTGFRVPSYQYQAALSSYYQGNYNDGSKEFSRYGLKTGDGYWIDSACYATMLGECHYQSGNLPKALEQYEHALKLFISYRNWLLQMQFPAEITEVQKLPTTVTWWQSKRNLPIGRFADSYPSVQTRLTQTAMPAGIQAPPGTNSALMAQSEAYPVDAAEILRCLTTAIRRRTSILGETGQYDPLTKSFLAAVRERPAPPGHWSQCWISTLLGHAYLAEGNFTEAKPELQAGTICFGLYDHPLAAQALIGLAEIAIRDGAFDDAVNYYMEATASAAYFEHYDEMEDGFRGALLAQRLSGKPGLFATLPQALSWARDWNKLETTIALVGAENACDVGDDPVAQVALANVQKSMHRTDLGNSSYAAWSNFIAARLQFAEGAQPAGMNLLGKATKFQRNASTRGYQIANAISLRSANQVTNRQFSQLLDRLLPEPTALEWQGDPYRALSFATTDRVSAIEKWFESKLETKEVENAIAIGELLKRHRFHSALPFSERLISLRWLLESHDSYLSNDEQLLKVKLKGKYPSYERVSKELANVEEKLLGMPLAPATEADKKKQQQLFAELNRLSNTAEMHLRDMATRAEPSTIVFPPALDTKAFQAKLPPRTLVLNYVSTEKGLYGFALSSDRYATFKLESPAKLRTEIAAFLKSIGNVDRNSVVSTSDLESASWRAPARKLLKQLTNQMPDGNWANFDELVVIPDGNLWYVPFEAFPATDDDSQYEPLISKIRVRYAPTLSLALPMSKINRVEPRLGIVAGRLFPKQPPAIAAGEAEKLTKVFPNSLKITAAAPSPSAILGSQLDSLVVLHDSEDNKGIWSWSPIPVDRGKPGSELADWVNLPWRGPETVVLPGFHSSAESALKKASGGEDMFFASMALMASGSRTILLSRWRTGGNSAFDLAREFVQETPHSPASVAWRRSVQLLMQNAIDVDAEPRLKSQQAGEEPSPKHPFFWAGYCLVDTGLRPAADGPKEEPKAPAPEKNDKALPEGAIPPAEAKPIPPADAKPMPPQEAPSAVDETMDGADSRDDLAPKNAKKKPVKPKPNKGEKNVSAKGKGLEKAKTVK